MRLKMQKSILNAMVTLFCGACALSAAAADVVQVISADESTVTGYASITAAANALNASDERGSTMKMIADINITSSSSAGTFVLLTNPEMTFDLNGHTLTAGHTSSSYPALKIANGANVTITDTSAGGTGKVVSKCCGIYIATAGTRVTLEKGAFSFSSTSTGLYGAYVANGEFVMNGGSIAGTSSKKSYGIYTSAGSATVNGGSITMTGTATSTSYINYALCVYGAGAMKVTGGTIEAKNASSCYTIYQAGATKGIVTITGGTIIATGTGTGATANSVVAYGYNFQISGGDFLSRRTAGTAAGYAIYSMGGSALRGGYFATTQGSADVYGTGLVKGGSFVHEPAATAYATGSLHADISPAEEHEIAGTSYSFAHTAAQDPSLPDVAETTGGVKHKSFDDAFFAVPEGGTVKLLADWNLGHTSGSCSINIDKTMTLDLNGHTVEGGSGSGSELFKASAGTFTLTDTSAGGAGQALGMEYFAKFAGSSHFVLAGGTCGTASGCKVQYGIYLSDSASFTMDGGRLDFVGNAPYAVYPNSKGGAVTINDGEIVCVGTNTYAVGINQYGEGYSPVTVNGGKIVVVATRQVSNAYATGVQGSDFTINGGTICVRGITESYESYAVKGDGVSTCVINGGNFSSAGGTDLTHDVTGCLVKGGSFEHGAAPATPYEIVATTGTADLPASSYLAEVSFALTRKTQLAAAATPCIRLANGQEYLSFADAVADLAVTDTVTVLRDFSMGSVRLFLPDDHATTLDLNGHVIDATGIAGKYASSLAMGAISLYSGSLTIADTSVAGNGRLNASEVGIVMQKNGTADLLITGGAISAYSANGAAAAVNREDGASGVVRMTGGSVLCDAYTTAYGFYCYNSAAVYQIEGGAIHLKKRQDSGSMSYAKLVNNSTTEITGGKFTMETPACDGGYFGTGVKVKGGTYSFDPTSYVPLSNLSVFEDGAEKITPFTDELTLTYRVAVDPDAPYRMQNMTTGVTYYDPILAISEVNAGETLQVLRDFDVGTSPIAITRGFTLDLNGHVMSSQLGTGVLSITGATDANPLTITDSARALGVKTGGIKAYASNGIAVDFASTAYGWNVTFDDVVIYSAGINALRDQSTSTTRNSITVRNAVVTVENTGTTESTVYSAIRSVKGYTQFTVTDSEVTFAHSNCVARSDYPVALFNLGTTAAGGSCVISGGVYRVVGPNIEYAHIFLKTHASKVVSVADGSFSIEPSASAAAVSFYGEAQKRSIDVTGGYYSDNIKPDTWITPATSMIIAATDQPGYAWRVVSSSYGNAAKIGDVEYATLEAAVAAVASGAASGTITLLRNETCHSTLALVSGVTIDGNGNVITLKGNPAMTLAPGATMPDCLYETPAASLVTPAGGTNVYYTTLARALSAAKTTQVVKLERDVEETIVATTRIIDLNGHNVTYKTSDYVGLVRFSKGQAGSSYTITLTNSSETVSTVENTADYGYGATVAKYATGLSVGDGTKHLVVCARVKLKANLAVFIADEDCTLDLYGTAEGVVHNSAAGSAIMGNGTSGYEGTGICVYEGAEAIGYAGSYHPQNGLLEIEGGTWSGTFSALYIKSGDILIWGGSFTGSGAKRAFQHDDSGYYQTGDGVVFESCDYPGGDPTAHVFGGIFASSNNQPIAVYQYGDGVAISNFVWGAVLNKQPDSGLIADGFAASEIAVDGSPWWIVGTNVTVDALGAVYSGTFTFDPAAYAAPHSRIETRAGEIDGIALTLWDVFPPYRVTYVVSGTGEPAGATAPDGFSYWDTGSAWTLDKPTYASDDTTFDGWRFGATERVANELPSGSVGDLTLYATWTAAQVIEVKPDAASAANLPIKVTQEWIDENVTPVGGEPTKQEIQDELNKTDENGNLKWENYVMGLAADASVIADAPQNADLQTVNVVPNAVAPREDTGFSVCYSLDEVKTNGSVVVDGEETTRDNLRIDLNAVESNAFFKVNVIVKKDGEATGKKFAATNTLGVLKVESAAQKTVVAVPWEELGPDARSILVSNVVKTANLTPMGTYGEEVYDGDKLHVYDYAKGAYHTWYLAPDQTWKPYGADEADPAFERISRGSAVWLERRDTTKPFYVYGQFEGSAVATKVEKRASTDVPSWNLVAAPSVDPLDIAQTFVGELTEGAQIIVPTADAPKNFTYEGGAWGYEDLQVYTNAAGKVRSRSVRRTDDTLVPPGIGLWYLNKSSGEKTINW